MQLVDLDLDTVLRRLELEWTPCDPELLTFWSQSRLKRVSDRRTSVWFGTGRPHHIDPVHYCWSL